MGNEFAGELLISAPLRRGRLGPAPTACRNGVGEKLVVAVRLHLPEWPQFAQQRQ